MRLRAPRGSHPEGRLSLAEAAGSVDQRQTWRSAGDGLLQRRRELGEGSGFWGLRLGQGKRPFTEPSLGGELEGLVHRVGQVGPPCTQGRVAGDRQPLLPALGGRARQLDAIVGARVSAGEHGDCPAEGR